MNLPKTFWRVVKKPKTHTQAYSPTASKNCNFWKRDIVRFWRLKCVWAGPRNIFYAWDQMSIVIYTIQKKFNPLTRSRRFGLKQDITSSILSFGVFFRVFLLIILIKLLCIWAHIKHNGNRVSQSLKVMLLFTAVKVFKITISQWILKKDKNWDDAISRNTQQPKGILITRIEFAESHLWAKYLF